MQKKKTRSLSVEDLERRVVLDGVGLGAAAAMPDWESVIVAVNNDVAEPGAIGRAIAAAHGGCMGHVYEHALKGFSAQLPEAAIKALSKNPHVKSIEPDFLQHAVTQTVPTGVDRIDADLTLEASEASITIDVDVAIIDTGIDMDHLDLNVEGGVHYYTINTGPPRNRGAHEDSNFEDDNGHGSHVAGIVGALDNDIGVVGVAPGVRLWGVKVLGDNGSGYTSDIIAGIEWVTQNADTIEVANMSLGGQAGVDSSAYRTAIQNSVAAGVVYFAAAGNDWAEIYGSDNVFGTSDDFIPAAYPEVATVSAFADSDGQPGGHGADTSWGIYGEDDRWWGPSNFSNSSEQFGSDDPVALPVTSDGLAVDLVLPGVDIHSTYMNGGYATMSGTSMASPHAAGLAALHIAANGRANSAAEVYDIRQALIDQGKAWDSAVGLLERSDGFYGGSGSPDGHMENLGWADTAPVPDVTDIAVTTISAPISVVQGDTASIDVTIENVGNQDVTSKILVSLTESPDEGTFEDKTISDGLTAGTSTTVTFSWDTTNTSSGDHILTARHDFADEVAANNSNTATVTVSEVSDTMHVAGLDASKNVMGRSGKWQAIVTVIIVDGSGALLPGATVSGEWTGDTTGSANGTTDSNGTITFTSPELRGSGSVTFTVIDVVHDSYTYEASNNLVESGITVSHDVANSSRNLDASKFNATLDQLYWLLAQDEEEEGDGDGEDPAPELVDYLFMRDM